MKIAVFDSDFLLPRHLAGSPTVLIQDQLETLSKYVDEAIIITEPKEVKEQRSIPANFKLYQVRNRLNLLRLLFYLKDQTVRVPGSSFYVTMLSTMTKILEREKVDVLYSCGSQFMGAFVGLVGCLTGIPTVHYVFQIPSVEWCRAGIMEGHRTPLTYNISHLLKNALLALPQRRFLVRWGLRRVNVLVASSKYVKQKLNLWRSDYEELTVIYPWVKTWRQEPILVENAPQILYFGNFWWGRGALDVAKAFHRIARKIPDVKLTIAPSNVHRITLEYFLRLISRQNLQNRVIWKGPVKDLGELFVPARLIMLPNRLSPSLKLLEAFSSGRPVITTNLEWVPELVLDGLTGYAVNPGDVTALAERAETLLTSYDLSVEMATRTANLITQICNMEDNTRKIVHLMQKAKSM